MSRECGVYQESVSNSKMQSLETLWRRTCLLEYQTIYYTHLQWVSHNMHGLCSSYVLVSLTTTCQVTIQILLPKIYFGTLNTLGGGFRVPLQSATWWNPLFKDNKMKLFFFLKKKNRPMLPCLSMSRSEQVFLVSWPPSTLGLRRARDRTEHVSMGGWRFFLVWC